MSYKNSKGQPREKCKIVAYSLINEYGAHQSSVADVFGVSQSTASNWNKEVGFCKKVHDLENALRGAQDRIEDLLNKPNSNKLDHKK